MPRCLISVWNGRMDVVCGWMPWEGGGGGGRLPGRPPGSGSDLRGGEERSLFVPGPVGFSAGWGFSPLLPLHRRGRGWVCLVRHQPAHRLAAGAPQQEGELGERSGAGSGKRFGANSAKVPNVAPPVISLVAWGKLLNQL